MTSPASRRRRRARARSGRGPSGGPPHVAVAAARPGRRTHQAQMPRPAPGGRMPVSSKRGAARRRSSKTSAARPVDVALRQPTSARAVPGAVRRSASKRTPPGRTSPRPKRLPQRPRRRFRKSPAQPPEPRGAGQVAHVAAQGAEIAHVVGQALQLEADGAHGVGSRADGSTPGERLHAPGNRRVAWPTTVSPAIDSAIGEAPRSGRPSSSASAPRC